MLVSIRHNFALLKMPKCASTTLQRALAKHCDIRFGGTPQLKHVPYRTYEQYVLPLIAEQFRRPIVCQPFSLFREPLSWLFSWYRFRMRSQLATAPDDATRMNYTGNITFEQFLNEHFRASPPSFARVGRQSQFIESMNGRHDAVTLYRYEDLLGFVAHMERRIGKCVRLSMQNASPLQKLNLSEKQITEARASLSLEYAIYDRIVPSELVPTDASTSQP